MDKVQPHVTLITARLVKLLTSVKNVTMDSTKPPMVNVNNQTLELLVTLITARLVKLLTSVKNVTMDSTKPPMVNVNNQTLELLVTLITARLVKLLTSVKNVTMDSTKPPMVNVNRVPLLVIFLTAKNAKHLPNVLIVIPASLSLQQVDVLKIILPILAKSRIVLSAVPIVSNFVKHAKLVSRLLAAVLVK